MNSKQEMTSRASLHGAMDRIADLYDYGHLQLSSFPADFLNQVCDEIETLRAANAALNAKIAELDAATGGGEGA